MVQQRSLEAPGITWLLYVGLVLAALLVTGTIVSRNGSTPTDGIYYQPFPGCEPILANCKWQSRYDAIEGDRVISVDLLDGSGKVVGNVELMEINVADFTELTTTTRLTEMGIDRVWIAHIRVVRSMRGMGIGRMVWQAGDIALKNYVGGGAVRVIVDGAGWVKSLLRGQGIDFIVEGPPYWIYYVK